MKDNPPDRISRKGIRGIIAGAAVAVLLATALFVALAWGAPGLLRPAVLGLLAGLTALFAVCLLIALFRGDELSLESRWRGFGGGLGGWRASAALGMLLAVLIFGCLTVLATTITLQPGQGGTTPTSEATVAPAAASTAEPPVE